MYERGSEKAVENKDFHIKKTVMIGLAGVLVVVAGILGSLFYIYDTDMKARQEELGSRLAKAQQELEELQQENEILKEEEEELVMAMNEAETEPEYETLPFRSDDWKLILVNELNPLAKDFEVELADIGSGQKVDARIKSSLEKMIADAKEDGLNLMVCSSFRTYEKQDKLMDQSIRKNIRKGLDYKEAFFKAKEQIALTGASEHHTGLAVDIVGTDHQSLDRSQADTKEAIWLSQHAQDYGFILRYPEDKEELTMITFESWHYRYVGKDAAVYMKENNLCLEEFVERLQLQESREAEMEQASQ